MGGTEEQKRLVRRLIGSGRGLAETWGFRVANNPANLFQLLYLSILLRPRGDYQRAMNTALALRDRGWDSPARMARALQVDRFRLIRDVSHRRDAQEVAAVLGDLALTVGEKYRGDLRRLRTESRQDPHRIRALLVALPAVDDEVVDLFFREVQAIWPEVAPCADRRALTAARRLGLGRSPADLAALAGGRESERLAWLVGALARVELEKRYGEFREPARA
ncbi:MAG TPA: hypothetical protein VHN18_08710 [Micromonosporaceae bacterium]|nr:hypothetical protein [Micromonosporaceae bacterium]